MAINAPPQTDRILRFLETSFLGNSLRDYAICAVTIFIGLLLVKVFQMAVMRRMRKWFASTSTVWDDWVVATLEANAVPALYLLVAWMAFRDLELKAAVRDGLRVAVAIAITILAVRVILALVNQAIKAYWQRHAAEKTADKEKSLQGITTLAKLVICILAGILLLDNLGIRISAFVTGLGVTGIAVALAAQAILGDLFGYFVIFFDQPFEVGHAIKVGEFSGEVERIGLKTTRLRGADGEQVIFSNKFLTDSRIQNYKRMVRRRSVISFEVAHGTPVEVLEGIPGRVQAILGGFPDATFERAHFVVLGETGPRFEVSYVVETPAFNRHMEIRQALNLALYAQFQEEGIAFGIPSRAVFVRSDGGSDDAEPGFPRGPAGSGQSPVSPRPD